MSSVMQETSFKCPRRSEAPYDIHPRDNDYDPSDDTCNYCGSMNPDTFMERVEAGDVELGATDKNYKVYVRNSGGKPFGNTYRDCPKDKEMVGASGNKYMVSSCDRGPDECTHWVTRTTDSTKFYFQHLSVDQRKRFIELMNQDGKLKMKGGFRFYVMPFFCQKVSIRG